jgi:hypothetical protein
LWIDFAFLVGSTRWASGHHLWAENSWDGNGGSNKSKDHLMNDFIARSH